MLVAHLAKHEINKEAVQGCNKKMAPHFLAYGHILESCHNYISRLDQHYVSHHASVMCCVPKGNGNYTAGNNIHVFKLPKETDMALFNSKTRFHSYYSICGMSHAFQS
ncbi:uncharacterized protein LOC126480878 [Schistocerca serialis cubense]|uniref:uncharacterized protein LOC126480878 n=1 Tax=Schistocerca serialis cubense TaxID=2023355 RepID=UPI00214E71CC|nr:uncharacterized protein LOC126480878 [Schistocerca serialis cubense]